MTAPTLTQAILALKQPKEANETELRTMCRSAHNRAINTAAALAAQAEKPSEQKPVALKVIGWRTGDFLYETADRDMALNWQGNIDVLPIFEGDLNTKLAATVAQDNTLREAAIAWWEGHRPLAWNEQQHIATPAVNCCGPFDGALALAVATVVNGPNAADDQTAPDL